MAGALRSEMRRAQEALRESEKLASHVQALRKKYVPAPANGTGSEAAPDGISSSAYATGRQRRKQQREELLRAIDEVLDASRRAETYATSCLRKLDESQSPAAPHSSQNQQQPPPQQGDPSAASPTTPHSSTSQSQPKGEEARDKEEGGVGGGGPSSGMAPKRRKTSAGGGSSHLHLYLYPDERRQAAIPAQALVAARISAAGRFWILCRVVRHVPERDKYLLEDEADEASGKRKRYSLNPKNVIRLPATESDDCLTEYAANTRVYAVYPQTTTFYPATVRVPFGKQPPKKHGLYTLLFEGEDPDSATGAYPTQDVPFRHVIRVDE